MLCTKHPVKESATPATTLERMLQLRRPKPETTTRACTDSPEGILLPPGASWTVQKSRNPRIQRLRLEALKTQQSPSGSLDWRCGTASVIEKDSRKAASPRD